MILGPWKSPRLIDAEDTDELLSTSPYTKLPLNYSEGAILPRTCRHLLYRASSLINATTGLARSLPSLQLRQERLASGPVFVVDTRRPKVTSGRSSNRSSPLWGTSLQRT